jgi:DNA adenine methylase
MSSEPLPTPPLKWHGGKHYIAKAVLELMPPHQHYVEPYFGGGQVLFARDPADRRYWWAGRTSDGRPSEGVSEVVNDRHQHLMNFYAVLKDPQTFGQLQHLLDLTQHSESEWEAARGLLRADEADPVRRAAALFTFCRQSLSARMTAYQPVTRTRLRGGREGEVNAWRGAVEGLEAVHRRLQDVRVLCRDAVDVIEQEDAPATLFYCDPPYVHETRTATKVYGPHEMTEADHRRLLDVLRACKGKVILSGYPSALYDTFLSGWGRREVPRPNNAAGGKKKRLMTEVLWFNFEEASR